MKFDELGGDLDIYLQPKQEQLYRFLKAKGPNIATNIGYGGSRGGAKSGGAQRCALALALEEPGIAIMIFRRLYVDLRDNHITKFMENWPVLAGFHKVADKEILLPKGSRIVFRYAENEKDLMAKTRGQEYKYIFLDQAEEFLESEMKRLKTCNRWPGTAVGECKMVYMFNPGGPGTDYLRRVFWLREYFKNERAQDFEFIQAYGWDNFQWFREAGLGITQDQFYGLDSDQRFELYINHTDYGRQMNGLPESLRMGELLGRFDRFAGQYFSGVWDESKCILTVDETEKLIQPWWTRWTATDWGFAHHAAHLWFATGKLGPMEAKELFGASLPLPIDVVVVYRELLISETPENQLATMCVDMTPESERKHLQYEFLSPDAFAKKGSANTVAEQMQEVFQRHSLPTPQPADNDRIGGWRLLYHGFRQSCSLRGSDVSPEMCRSGPMLLVSGLCPELSRAVPILVRDKDNLEDVLKTPTASDDIADCLRYGYKSFLEPRGKPREVRAQEEAAKYTEVTSMAIAMQKFNLKERQSLVRARHRS